MPRRRFSPKRVRMFCLTSGAVMFAVIATTPANAQYYNSDAGHSLRVEDATPQPLRSLSFDLFNGKAERLNGGTARYRYEPAMDWGILPNTEIGVRFPLVLIQPTRSSALQRLAGLAGVAIGGIHAFTIESRRLPALAIASEVLLPVGALAADQPSFSVKTLVTKRVGVGRLHFNVGGGTYSVRTSPPTNGSVPCDPATGTRFGNPFQGSCDDPPVIVDAPCSRYGLDDPVLAVQSTSVEEIPAPPRTISGSSSSNSSSAAPSSNSTLGRTRWSTAVGFDHAFALRSTSVGVDYIAEKFNGLYSVVDQTAELGFRMQATPSTVMHGAMSWHFAGVVQSFSVGAGVTMEFAWPLVHRRGSR